MSELGPGDDIDGFVLGELVHSGRVASVFRTAARPALGVDFPLSMKIPRTGIRSGVEGLLGFETELAVLPHLHSPHVPRFVAAGDLARIPYLVVEWVDGNSLYELTRNAPLPIDVVQRYGAAVADALHSIHVQGAIHLDLKPENVIIRPSGEAVIIDFGMAHHTQVPDLLAEERHLGAGSAPYVSPEQVRGIRSDVRSDLFALGVMLYEMATGMLPYGTPETFAGLGDRLWLDPIPPREHVPALPDWVQEIVLRCLEISPEHRYQSAAHVALDLRQPEQVPLTARATKKRRLAMPRQLARWWESRHLRLESMPRPTRMLDSPVIMVAVDTMHPDDPRHPFIRQATARTLAQTADFRLICVSIVHGEPSEGQRGIHLEHLIRLRHWADPLRVGAGRLSMHVIESLNPARVLLEFAAANNVDLIIIGAPGPWQQALAWWRSVASSVTASAPCSVHVVRIAEPQ